MSEIMGDRGLLEVETLPFWTGPIKIWPLIGGADNRLYGVQQADGQRFAVRLGQDLPQHGVMRFNEQEAARAAAKAGISPRIYFTAPGVMVSRLLPGRVLGLDEVRQPHNLIRIVALLKRCHTGMPAHLHGPLLAFWVFHINRSYFTLLNEIPSELTEHLPRLMVLNEALERRAGKVDIVFAHNDLQTANIFDDGARLWLLQWDYAGFNTPLFDLANLSANNGFFPADDIALLDEYYGDSPDAAVQETFHVFKCASLLRDVLRHELSRDALPFSFEPETSIGDTLARLDRALADLG